MLVALALACWTTPARADLGHDVEALTLAWSAFGHVLRLKPRLLERGDVLPLVLPPEPLDPKSDSCATLAIIGTKNLEFLLSPGRRARQSPGDWPDGSLAGALSVTRCGPAKVALAALTLEMRSPRGVLEFLLVTSEHKPPRLAEVLPQREPGLIAQATSSGPRPVVAPLAERVRALEARAARDQAREVTTHDLTAGRMGLGSARLVLAPGCHRFALVGEETERRATDVDLEITSSDDEILAADHGESSDGQALVCLPAPAEVSVRFGGVAPSAHLTLVQARWDLDPALPTRWPAVARARMSGLLLSERRSLGSAALVDEALGVQGDTLSTVAVEPGACYLALVVTLQGDASSLSLAAETARKVAQGRIAEDVPGAALTFCAGADEHALVEVDARGLGIAWMSGVWRIARTRLGEAGR